MSFVCSCLNPQWSLTSFGLVEGGWGRVTVQGWLSLYQLRSSGHVLIWACSEPEADPGIHPPACPGAPDRRTVCRVGAEAERLLSSPSAPTLAVTDDDGLKQAPNVYLLHQPHHVFIRHDRCDLGWVSHDASHSGRRQQHTWKRRLGSVFHSPLKRGYSCKDVKVMGVPDIREAVSVVLGLFSPSCRSSTGMRTTVPPSESWRVCWRGL